MLGLLYACITIIISKSVFATPVAEPEFIFLTIKL